MSFAYDVKAELCKVPINRSCCAVAEGCGVLLYASAFTANEVRIVTENDEFAARLPKLFQKAFSLRFDELPDKSKDGGKLVGLLCINFDDSRFHEISDAILKLIHPDDFVHHHYFPVDAPAKQPMQPQHPAPDPAEHFQSDMNGLMEELFDTVTKSVSVPLDRLTQAERTQIIAKLYDQGMFELRGAVQFTVHKLACSQASIYRYIKKVKSQTE